MYVVAHVTLARTRTPTPHSTDHAVHINLLLNFLLHTNTHAHMQLVVHGHRGAYTHTSVRLTGRGKQRVAAHSENGSRGLRTRDIGCCAHARRLPHTPLQCWCEQRIKISANMCLIRERFMCAQSDCVLRKHFSPLDATHPPASAPIHSCSAWIVDARARRPRAESFVVSPLCAGYIT